MKPNIRFSLATIIVTGLLAGCSASGLSTHGNATDHLNTDRSTINSSNFSQVSLKGDASKQFLVEGQKHFNSQNFGLAELSFRKAVELRSDNASAWLGLAASYDQLGRFDFSDRAYEQLTQLKQNDARVLNNIGYSYLLRGEYDKARNYLSRAQNIDPSLEEIEGNIHLLEKTVRS